MGVGESDGVLLYDVLAFGSWFVDFSKFELGGRDYGAVVSLAFPGTLDLGQTEVPFMLFALISDELGPLLLRVEQGGRDK